MPSPDRLPSPCTLLGGSGTPPAEPPAAPAVAALLRQHKADNRRRAPGTTTANAAGTPRQRHTLPGKCRHR